MEIIPNAIEVIKKVFKKNNAVKEFQDDFATAFIDWIRPIFLEEVRDTKITKAFDEQEITEKIEQRLEIKLEDLIDQNAVFKKELEAKLAEAESKRVAPVTVSIDNSQKQDNVNQSGSGVNIGQARDISGTIINSVGTLIINQQQKQLLLPEEYEQSPIKPEISLSSAKKLLRSNRLQDTLDVLSELTEQPKYQRFDSYITLFFARWNNLKSQITKEIISYDNAQVSKGKLWNSIEGVIKDMQRED